MKRLLVGAAMMAASTGAHAFEESKGGGGPVVDSSPKSQIDVSGTGTSIEPSTPQGLEIRVPGLGRLGVLPKLDFGLELLYGGSATGDPAGPGPGTPRVPQEEETKIRGTVKHRW